MLLAGVVVLYNPNDSVKENVASYLDSCEVVFAIDNSNNDNSALFDSDKIKYVPNFENKGIAAALNQGATLARENGYKWLLTMDQDSRFCQGQVEEMKAFIDRANNDPDTLKVYDTSADKLGLISPLHRTMLNQHEKPIGIDSPLILMTSGNIINLSIHQKLGGFKDWMFIDMVDMDYCLNLRKNGYGMLRLNYVELEHNLGDAMRRKILNQYVFCLNHSPMRRYYIVRNRHYLSDMYKDTFPEYCKLEIGRTRREAFKIFMFEKQKCKKLLAMYSGYRAYKKGLKGKRPEK